MLYVIVTILYINYILTYKNIIGSDLTNVNLSNSNLSKTSLQDCSLNNTNLSNVTFFKLLARNIIVMILYMIYKKVKITLYNERYKTYILLHYY